MLAKRRLRQIQAQIPVTCSGISRAHRNGSTHFPLATADWAPWSLAESHRNELASMKTLYGPDIQRTGITRRLQKACRVFASWSSKTRTITEPTKSATK